MMSPPSIPQSEPVSYEGKNVLVLWCPGGYDRPYRCPQKPTKKGSKRVYYIRKLASTIEATDIDFKELLALAHNVPFDDRINPKGEMQDLKYPLLKGYLEEARSRKYRNRCVGDFLKELHLVEGRNTGIPTALRAIRDNGSPLPVFLTDEDRIFSLSSFPSTRHSFPKEDPEDPSQGTMSEKPTPKGFVGGKGKSSI